MFNIKAIQSREYFHGLSKIKDYGEDKFGIEHLEMDPLQIGPHVKKPDI